MNTKLDSRQTLFLISLAITVVSASGCRAISRNSESRDSIAARRMSRQGIQAMHQGRWDTAETLFNKALVVSETDDRAHRGLAESLWQRNEQVAAIGHLEEAVRLSAGDPKLLERLGQMYMAVGRIHDAEKQSALALAADQNSPQAWALRGQCLFAKKDYEEALAAYHQALALQPDFAEAQYQAAEIYRVQGRYDRLLATLDCLQEGATEELPARVDALRGIAMRELGRGNDALRSFQKAAVKDPADVETRLMIASICLQQGHFELARESIQIANQLNPLAVQKGGWLQQLEASQNRVVSGEVVSPTLKR